MYMDIGGDSFSLGQYMVFQAEVYAINACSDNNIGRDYKNRNIYILLDNQIVTKAAETTIRPLCETG
jgi:hypothetical protein